MSMPQLKYDTFKFAKTGTSNATASLIVVVIDATYPSSTLKNRTKESRVQPSTTSTAVVCKCPFRELQVAGRSKRWCFFRHICDLGHPQFESSESTSCKLVQHNVLADNEKFND